MQVWGVNVRVGRARVGRVRGTGAVKVYQIPVGAGAGKKFQPWNSSRCVLQCNSCLDT